MKMKSLWVAGALTLAFVCTPFALAGANTAVQYSAATPAPQPDRMKAMDPSPNRMKAMSGYRDWTVEQMMVLQKALTAQGFPVTADGKWSQATRSAVMNFQKKNGLQPTGYPNQDTVKKLGITLPK
ncbi:MAG: peptidoglycan-binding domain-containing protein [Gammaproteobacteria bacterium]